MKCSFGYVSKNGLTFDRFQASKLSKFIISSSASHSNEKNFEKSEIQTSMGFQSSSKNFSHQSCSQCSWIETAKFNLPVSEKPSTIEILLCSLDPNIKTKWNKKICGKWKKFIGKTTKLFIKPKQYISKNILIYL